MRSKVQSAVETQQQELPNPPASNCTLKYKALTYTNLYQPQKHLVSFHCLLAVSWKLFHLPVWKSEAATHHVIWKTEDTPLEKLSSDLPGIERRAGALQAGCAEL